MKKHAFTLAEVMITLGIIGVVSALTIPIIVNKYIEIVTVTKLKKMNNILTNAYNSYLADNEPINCNYDESGSICVFKAFEKNLKILKNCGTKDKNCIYNGYYKKKNGVSHENYNNRNEYYKIILADNSTIFFKGSYNSTYNAEIFYDINGIKPPNKWGYDLFVFDILGEKIFPVGIPGERNFFNNTCSSANSEGLGCTAWVIYKGNMDYLKKNNLKW